MKKLFTWLIDKWLAGFITASIFFVINLYMNLPDERKTEFFRFQWLTSIMNTKFSFWAILILVVVLILITRIEKYLYKSKKENTKYDYLKTPSTNFQNYKTDVFGVNQTKYTWRYNWKPYDQEFEIVNLKPSCKNCNTPMEVDSKYAMVVANCHKCRLEGRPSGIQLEENLSDVEKEIIRRIESDEFVI